ncbi:MAG TPA: SDR family oxidoreductase [Xanthobacteraceae bacterium]|nr:SDR family oxidoreductase [Xanthobacteraceae bacterium]
MKKVFVSGAGGYIGVPLCEQLLKSNYDVIAFDRYFFGHDVLGHLSNEKFRSIVGDIRDIEPGLLEGVDAVIDLAGLSNDASAEIDVSLTQSINNAGGRHLASVAKAAGVRRYIYSSSASVYGHGAKSHLTETDPCHPQTEYARSKLAIETALKELQGADFETVILRNATVFGLARRMRFDLAVNIMTLRAWRDRVIYIMGGGEQWRPFIHVRDVVRAMQLALESPASIVSGEIFNVGSDSLNYQIKNLSQFVQDVIPNVTIHVIPDNPDLRDYHLSFEKIKRVLKFDDCIQVHEGIVEIKQALERGVIRGDDPRFYTLQWYSSIMEWEKRIKELSLKGRIF